MARFCKYCGSNISEGAAFCPKCGKNLAQKGADSAGGQNDGTHSGIQNRYVMQGQNQGQPRQFVTPTQARGYSQSVAKKNYKGAFLALIIAASALLVFVITAFLAPGFLLEKAKDPGDDPVEKENKRQEGKTVSLSNGVMTLNGLTVDFSDTGVSDGNATLTEEKEASDEKENGLISDLFSISYDEDVSGNVTVSLPVPEAYDESQGGVLRLGIGRDYTTEDGVVITPFQYFDATISDGYVTASFDPSTYTDATFFGRAEKGETGFIKKSLKSADAKNYGEVKRYVGWFLKDSFYYENGHFEVWYPFNLKINLKDREPFLSDLESIYTFYEEKGYMMGNNYPMEVNISRVIKDEDGCYEKGSITLKASLLFGEEKKGGEAEAVYPSHQTDARELIKHEFFHAIQANYLGWMTNYQPTAKLQQSLWFDEATAVYYEANETGRTSCKQSNDYLEKIWEGLMPDNKFSADAGYGRGPLVAFVTEKLGSEEWIKDVYNSYYEDGTPINDTIRPYFESIPNAATEFYNGVVTGKYCSIAGGLKADHMPGKIYYYIKKRDPYVSCAASELSVTEPDNKKTFEEALKNRESITLKEHDLTLNGTGAHLFGMNISLPTDEIPEDYQVTLYCDGCEVTLYEVSNLNNADPDKLLSGKTLTLKQIKKARDDGRDYLAVVVSSAPIGEKTNTTFKVVLEPADDWLVGKWIEDGEPRYGDEKHYVKFERLDETNFRVTQNMRPSDAGKIYLMRIPCRIKSMDSKTAYMIANDEYFANLDSPPSSDYDRYAFRCELIDKDHIKITFGFGSGTIMHSRAYTREK